MKQVKLFIAMSLDGYITVIPVILGSGVRLFGNESRKIPLKLIKTQSYNGMTDLIYTRRMKV